ncbi:hypothetical protein LZ31DRAFT_239299 [Colletotrichum somersetense]|nr:hypothetical protein LZ31DRAFT_239299 [Colletotrichum somersetense]
MLHMSTPDSSEHPSRGASPVLVHIHYLCTAYALFECSNVRNRCRLAQRRVAVLLFGNKIDRMPWQLLRKRRMLFLCCFVGNSAQPRNITGISSCPGMFLRCDTSFRRMCLG